jgi:uncharacterized protein YcbX
VAIWRYPIKSMLGEELNATLITERGLLGDRAHALVDAETGKVVSAKNPRRWPNMFDYRAAYVEPPTHAGSLPAVRITLPNGEIVTTKDADIESRLSGRLGHSVRLTQSAASGAKAEGYSPDYEWLGQRDQVYEFPLPPGTFFDCAIVHLVTTATLDRLRLACPSSRFEVPRFRPNLVIESPDGATGLVENDWVGRTLALGEVRLRIDRPCERCIMTMLSQGSLPRDPHVLRTLVQENAGNVGVYATVVRGGRVVRGDVVS